jgi:hypothetical protein
MWIDGSLAADVSWARIPIGQWAHVHLEAPDLFTDNLNLMSGRADGAVNPTVKDCLKVSKIGFVISYYSILYYVLYCIVSYYSNTT